MAADETPWALFCRLRAEGHPQSVIHERLRSLGLSDDDIKTLTLEAPPPATGLELPDAAKIATVLVAGPLLGGALLAATGESVAEREAPPPQVPLADDDPSARCSRHPTLASTGTCRICGTFVCRDCAGATFDLTGCVSCTTNPKRRRAALGRARVSAGLAFGAQVVLYAAAAFIDLGARLPYAVIALEVLWRAVIAGVLLGVQAFVRNTWPSWVLTAFGVAVMAYCGRHAPLLAVLSFAAVVAQVVTTVMLRSAFARDRSLDAAPPRKEA